jgi:hypothetical protein
MYKGIKPSFRTSQEVLGRISQEMVFLEWLGIYPDLYKKFHSPFRKDNTPDCRFEWFSGVLYFIENSAFNNKLYWSCIDVVMFLKKCSFQEALEIIDLKHNSSIKIISQNREKLKPEIRFTYNQWEGNLFRLDHNTLLSEQIYLVKDYWIKYKDYWEKNKIHRDTLTIAYFFPQTKNVKLYFPNHSDNRWFSNCSIQDIFGLDLLAEFGDLLIITKSQKDRIYLKYHLGFEHVIAVQNEGCFIPDNIITDLKQRFKRIIFLYDNDLSGIQQSSKLSSKYNLESKVIECSRKDIYDMYNYFEENNTKKLVYATINNIFT